MQDGLKSLSEFIRETREKAGFSVIGLSKRAGITPEQIEDIESGKDLFLPATIRQKLAKALKINPADIKIYERIMIDKYDKTDIEYMNSVKKAVLEGETENLRCPICASPLNTKIIRVTDGEGRQSLIAKAQCSKCPFQIK